MQLNDLLKTPLPIPPREQVEILVAEATRLVPVARLDLVNRVSHGIRTPLAAILGFKEILARDSALSDDDKRLFSSIINSESHRLQRFVASLQTFEELRTSQFQIERLPSDIRATIRSAIEALQGDATSKAISVRFPADKDPIVVEADHRRLGLAVEHLISNALKASPRGGIIDVAFEVSGNKVRITVTDTGLGIASEDVEQIFKPFKRFPRPDDNGSELGLGLTLARSITELNGGTISVSSVPAHGTCFAIELPL